MSQPIDAVWDGESFVPDRRFARICDAQFTIGERYRLVEHHERSWASHAHEFAWLAEAWRNLPEDIADQYPSSEHLRKRALIQSGFYDEQIVDAGTNAAAIRVASAFRAMDDFSLVVVRGPLVVQRTAKSQSVRSMGKADFQRSKTAILEIVSELVGVTSDTLTREAARAA